MGCLVLPVIENLKNIERVGPKREKNRSYHWSRSSLSFPYAKPYVILQCNDLFSCQSPRKPLEARDMFHCAVCLLQAWYHTWLKAVRARGVSSSLMREKTTRFEVS